MGVRARKRTDVLVAGPHQRGLGIRVAPETIENLAAKVMKLRVAIVDGYRFVQGGQGLIQSAGVPGLASDVQ